MFFPSTTALFACCKAFREAFWSFRDLLDRIWHHVPAPILLHRYLGALPTAAALHVASRHPICGPYGVELGAGEASDARKRLETLTNERKTSKNQLKS